MATIGERLGIRRAQAGKSLREFAGSIGEDHTLLSRIERGERPLPDRKIKKFAPILHLSENQLRKLKGIEKAGLNPDEFLPDIRPPFIPIEEIERWASKCLYDYVTSTAKTILYPVEAGSIFKAIYGLEVSFLDFEKENIYGKQGEPLYACLFPDGRFFGKKDKLILVNIGSFRGRRLTPSERLISLAHEAGHYAISYAKSPKSPQLALSFSKAPYYCSSSTYRENPFNQREYQATLFAACFLMPHEELLKTISYVDKVDLQKYGKSLCRKFGVTLGFLKFRLKTLGIQAS